MPSGIAFTAAFASLSRAVDRIERCAVGGFHGEPGEPGAILVARARAVAVPDIGANMMVIAAGRHEGRATAPPCQVEAHGAAVELLGLLDVADPQMDVADAQSVRRGG